ncbi:MAG: hypothetical protein AB3X44_05800 [Leptothrix sp. (in: b-proteobacteria)]
MKPRFIKEAIVLNPLLTSYEKASFGDYLILIESIIIGLTGNAHFGPTWPAHLPSVQMITDKFGSLRVAHQAALSRDVNKIAERDKIQAELNDMLRQIRPFLEMTANGDMAILKSTGFPLRTEYTRNPNPAPLPAPTGLRVTHGPGSGNLDAHVNKEPRAGGYEAALTYGDPSDESGWQHAATSTTASHIPVRGQTIGQILWVRVRCVKGTIYGSWSDPVRVVVI